MVEPRCERIQHKLIFKYQSFIDSDLSNAPSLASRGRHHSMLSERSNIGFLVAQRLEPLSFSNPY